MRLMMNDWLWWVTVGLVVSAHVAAYVSFSGTADHLKLPPVVEGKTSIALAARSPAAPREKASKSPSPDSLRIPRVESRDGAKKLLPEPEANSQQSVSSPSDLQRREHVDREPTTIEEESVHRLTKNRPQAPQMASVAESGSRAPAPIGRLKPTIPPELQGTRAFATVRFTVTKEGRVEKARVIKSSGHARWNQAVLVAIRRWRFHPASRNGQNVARDAVHTVNLLMGDR